MISWLKKYWFLLAGGALAIFVTMFDRRGQTIQQLKAQVRTTELETDIKRLKEESTHADTQAHTAAQDYDSLKRSNAQLAAKLGIKSGSNRPT